jgi:hypothetical protein
VIGFSEISDTMAFAVSTARLASIREKASSSRFHTIAVFDKLTGLTDEEKCHILVQHPISFVNALPNDEENDDLDGNMELTEDDESGLAYIKEMVDDCNSLEELIALYNTVSDEYSQLIELLYEDDSIREKLKHY